MSNDTLRILWMILKSNDGYTLEESDMEDYPSDHRAMIIWTPDPLTKSVKLEAGEDLTADAVSTQKDPS